MAPPPELIDDAIAEILLRIPPDEPGHLVRAAAVCKPWHRILSDGAFRRRYRTLHRSPFLLGFLHNQYDEESKPRFIAATAAPRIPIPAFDFRSWYALDCRHGRALLRSLGLSGLIVWDPISGSHNELAFPAYPHRWCSAAVRCATADGCDHRDCHGGGPFTVVFVGTYHGGDFTWACTYSSETGAWSAPTSIQLDFCVVDQRPGLFVSDAVYFIVDHGRSILKYGMTGRTLSVIDAPDVYGQSECIAITTDDGGLGFAGVKDGILFLWSWYAGPDGIAGWVQHRSFELLTLLPISLWRNTISFAEGTDTIVISTNVGVFTINLKSGHVRNLGVTRSYHSIVPYVSFYTPGMNNDLMK